jgi:LPS-assembly lipoprotein
MRTYKTKLVRAAQLAIAALLMAGTLAACGFQLRGSNGSYNMPFHSLFLTFPDTSPLGTELKRNLRATDQVVIADKVENAEAQFIVLAEARNKSILSLNSQGRVREYLLSYALSFTVRDAKGNVLLAPTEITLHRNMSFDETQVLAKESEEALLYRDMQGDLVQQIMRRLAAIKPS